MIPLKIKRIAAKGMNFATVARDMEPGECLNLDGVLVSVDGTAFTPPSPRTLSPDSMQATIHAAVWTYMGNRHTILSSGLDGAGPNFRVYSLGNISAAGFAGHSFYSSTTKIRNIVSYQRGAYQMAYYGSSTGVRRLRYDSATNFLVDEPAGVLAPILTPTGAGAAPDAYYRYFVSFVDKRTGMESNPVLHYEVRRALDIDATNTQVVPLVPYGSIPAAAPHADYDVILYRQGHNSAELRQVTDSPIGTVNKVTLTNCPAYTDVTRDSALSLTTADFARGVPPAEEIRYVLNSGGRLWAFTKSRAYYSKVGEPESWVTDDLPTGDDSDGFYLDIDAQVGNDIVAASAQGNHIIVFLLNGVTSIAGTGFSTWDMFNLITTPIMNYRCVSADADSVWFIGSDRRLYKIQASDFGIPNAVDAGEPIDERLRLYTQAQLDDMELLAASRLIVILIPGQERIILSTRDRECWTRATFDAGYAGAPTSRAIHSLRPEDGIVLLRPSNIPISYYRYEYDPTLHFDNGFTIETGWIDLGQECAVKSFSLAATFVVHSASSVTITAYKRKLNGDIVSASQTFSLDQVTTTLGDVVITGIKSTIVGEWVSVLITGTAEQARIRGMELTLEPTRSSAVTT